MFVAADELDANKLETTWIRTRIRCSRAASANQVKVKQTETAP